jgi:hypothetical protein
MLRSGAVTSKKIRAMFSFFSLMILERYVNMHLITNRVNLETPDDRDSAELARPPLVPQPWPPA